MAEVDNRKKTGISPIEPTLSSKSCWPDSTGWRERNQHVSRRLAVPLMQLQCVPENEGEHTIQACGVWRSWAAHGYQF
jgi:hypothetical protein